MKEKLWNRVKSILDKREVDKSHYAFYYENLNPEFIERQDKFTDEMINNQIASKELFWGLGNAIHEHLESEKEF